MNAIAAHPNRTKLHGFRSGQLADDDALAVHEHLAECSTCCETYASLPADKLTEILRRLTTLSLVHDSHLNHKPTTGEGWDEEDRSFSDIPKELVEHPRYRVLQLLGAGGMGTVFKAEHRFMNRTVALKVISSKLSGCPDVLERFQREVRAAALLSHPNIVTAYDADRAGDRHFLVMEYVEGISLARVIKDRGPLPVACACSYIRQAALGLQHAHERGMVHRDIKPQNLMLTPQDEVKILDFGLARFATDTLPPGLSLDASESESRCSDRVNSLTELGSVMGTPDYIAPEQAKASNQSDIRADVYSLGCTFYFLLAGAPPFDDQVEPDEKLSAQLNRTPRCLTEIRSDVSAEIVRVVNRMMEKDAARRYQEPADVAAALDRASEVDATESSGPTLEERQQDPPSTSKTKDRRVRGRSTVIRRCSTVALTAMLLFGGLRYGAGIYRIATNQGQLVIETEDDDVDVVVKKGGKEVTIIDLKSKHQVTLSAGKYSVQLVAPGSENDDLQLSTESFTLTRGDVEIVRVRHMRQEPSNESTDVLALVNLERDQISGSWSRVGTDMVIQPHGFARLAIPVIPDGSYELTLKLTRHRQRGAEINVMLPVGDAYCMASLGRGGDWHGIQLVDGRDFGTRLRGRWADHEPQTCLIRVNVEQEDASVAIEVNGSPAVRWAGHTSSLSVRENWRIQGGCLGLGAHSDEVVFHSVALRMLSGVVRPMRQFRRARDIAASEWTDVLQFVDLHEHRVLGNWERKPDGLLVSGGEYSRVMIPVVPDGNYEFRATLTRERGHDEINFILPVGNTSCMLSMPSGQRAMIQFAAPPDSVVAALTSDKFENSKKHSVLIRVHVTGPKAEIAALLDDEEVLQWEGLIADISPREDWRLHPNSLGIGAHFDTVVFHSAELHVLSGDSSLLER